MQGCVRGWTGCCVCVCVQQTEMHTTCMLLRNRECVGRPAEGHERDKERQEPVLNMPDKALQHVQGCGCGCAFFRCARTCQDDATFVCNRCTHQQPPSQQPGSNAPPLKKRHQPTPTTTSQQTDVCLRDAHAPAPQVCARAVCQGAHGRHLARAGRGTRQATLVVVEERVRRLNLFHMEKRGTTRAQRCLWWTREQRRQQQQLDTAQGLGSTWHCVCVSAVLCPLAHL